MDFIAEMAKRSSRAFLADGGVVRYLHIRKEISQCQESNCSLFPIMVISRLRVLRSLRCTGLSTFAVPPFPIRYSFLHLSRGISLRRCLSYLFFSVGLSFIHLENKSQVNCLYKNLKRNVFLQICFEILTNLIKLIDVNDEFFLAGSPDAIVKMQF